MTKTLPTCTKTIIRTGKEPTSKLMQNNILYQMICTTQNMNQLKLDNKTTAEKLDTQQQ